MRCSRRSRRSTSAAAWARTAPSSQADVCDSRSDANGEVACARQMVDDGVVATLNDLTFNNPAGVVDVLEPAGIPRIGIGGTDISEFGSSVSYPISAGVIAAYLGTAVGFKEDKDTRSASSAPTRPPGRPSRASSRPCSPPSASTSPATSRSRRARPTTRPTSPRSSVRTPRRSSSRTATRSHPAHRRDGAAQREDPAGWQPRDLRHRHAAEVPRHHEGHGALGLVPVPGADNVKNFPGLKQFFADMKASGKKDLSMAN